MGTRTRRKPAELATVTRDDERRRRGRYRRSSLLLTSRITRTGCAAGPAAAIRAVGARVAGADAAALVAGAHLDAGKPRTALRRWAAAELAGVARRPLAADAVRTAGELGRTRDP